MIEVIEMKRENDMVSLDVIGHEEPIGSLGGNGPLQCNWPIVGFFMLPFLKNLATPNPHPFGPRYFPKSRA